MKPPDLMAAFAAVPLAPEATAERLLDFLSAESKGHLDGYYTALGVMPDGQYDSVRELLDLKDGVDLIERIKRDRDAGFAIYLELGLYPALVHVWIFRDPNSPGHTAVLLRIDPAITRSLEEEEDNQLLTAVWLARVAAAIGSEWFISGPFIEQWLPIELKQLPEAKRWGRLFVVGWLPRSAAEAAVQAELKPTAEAVKHTTVGYDLRLDFPVITA